MTLALHFTSCFMNGYKIYNYWSNIGRYHCNCSKSKKGFKQQHILEWLPISVEYTQIGMVKYVTVLIAYIEMKISKFCQIKSD